MCPVKVGLLHATGMSSLNQSFFFVCLFLRETFSYFNPLCLQYEIKILDIYLFIKKYIYNLIITKHVLYMECFPFLFYGPLIILLEHPKTVECKL